MTMSAKKTAKKATARKATTPNPQPDGATDVDEAPPTSTTVTVPLYRDGTPTGYTRTITVRRPSSTQAAWAEGAMHRLSLAMEAFRAGEQFEERERWRVFADVNRMFKIYLVERDHEWIDEAMAAGRVEMADVFSAIGDAKAVLGIRADTAGVVTADVVAE